MSDFKKGDWVLVDGKPYQVIKVTPIRWYHHFWWAICRLMHRVFNP